MMVSDSLFLDDADVMPPSSDMFLRHSDAADVSNGQPGAQSLTAVPSFRSTVSRGDDDGSTPLDVLVHFDVKSVSVTSNMHEKASSTSASVTPESGGVDFTPFEVRKDGRASADKSDAGVVSPMQQLPNATPPEAVVARARSATSVMGGPQRPMKGFQDPNAAMVQGSPTSRHGIPSSLESSPNSGSGKKLFVVGAVQIKAASVVEVITRCNGDTGTQEMLTNLTDELLQRKLLGMMADVPSKVKEAVVDPQEPLDSAAVEPDTTTTTTTTTTEGGGESEGAASSPSPPKPRKKSKLPVMPSSLPAELKLPMPLRCDFCQRFDSVCSMCHFKWKAIAESRKSVFANSFHSLPDGRKNILYFLLVAYGHAPLVRVIAEQLGDKINEVQGVFVPQLATTSEGDLESLRQKFDDAGAVSLLHVAFALNRLEVAKILMDCGAILRRSEKNRRSPIDFLSFPIPESWQEMLDAQSQYVEFTTVERARRLRGESSFADALEEYKEVLKTNPYSESARCGTAKALFDMKRLTECIQQCNSILADQKLIRWVDHIPESVVMLKNEAVRALHEECHQDSSTALRKCGCVIVDETVHKQRIRRLPFRIITENIFPFCDCDAMWRLWQATRIPLLLSATERFAAKYCLETIGLMLTNEFGYSEMYEAIRADEPPTTGKNAVLKPPLRFLGVQVIAMADFHMFLMRASVVGGNPKYAEDSFFSFGKRSEESKRQRVVATKCFRVHRAAVGKAWDIGDSGEWEVDHAASDALLQVVQQRMTSR